MNREQAFNELNRIKEYRKEMTPTKETKDE